jgi:prepilin-type N-terminal cleavage/methylation domain-containing protein
MHITSAYFKFLKNFKKGFTLIEVLISLVIISLLVGVMFGIYTSILRLSVRIEQEKNLNNELLFASQTIQNLVDNYDLDLDYYFTGNTRNDIDPLGYSDTLALSSPDKKVMLKKVGECGQWSWCFLALMDGEAIKQLTNPFKVSVPLLQFRIIPYQFGSVDSIQQKWFWIYGKMTSSRYNTGKYELNVAQDIQLFFNIRKY